MAAEWALGKAFALAQTPGKPTHPEEPASVFSTSVPHQQGAARQAARLRASAVGQRSRALLHPARPAAIQTLTSSGPGAPNASELGLASSTELLARPPPRDHQWQSTVLQKQRHFFSPLHMKHPWFVPLSALLSGARGDFSSLPQETKSLVL